MSTEAAPNLPIEGFHKRQISQLRSLHSLLTDDFGQLESHAKAYLDAGCKMFGAQSAAVLRFKFLQDSAEVLFTSGDLFVPSASIDLSEPLLASSLEEKRAIFKQKVTVNSDAITYNSSVLAGSMVVPLRVEGQIYGLLCFLFEEDNNQAYGNVERDLETLELMAKGVAKMIQVHKVQQQTNALGGTQVEPFVTPGVKSFEEYVKQARIPDVYGVPGRVVDVLQKRIGHAPLSIDNIAQDLNLSKRTLQRRLQQQCISFAQLRDQVRYHHAVTHLVENSQSIDSISAILDFSDRTSFTNAFKRWTGLSPSAFRKLFRDYA